MNAAPLLASLGIIGVIGAVQCAIEWRRGGGAR
jgi:hypothetical protein